MADIFDEVSEELKQDRLLQIWRKFSKFIISFLIIIIVSIFSYQLYSNWVEKKLEANSKQFFSALEELGNNKYEKSSEIFLKSSSENSEGYRVLSLFGLAETSYKQGNLKEMATYYKYIYEDDKIDIYYRNLSRLLTVMKDEISSFEHQLNILKPILNSPSKLQSLAAELEVILYIRSNDINEASTKLKKLLERSDISFEQKTRLELIKKIYHSNAK